MKEIKKISDSVVNWFKNLSLSYKLLLFIPVAIFLSYYRFSVLIFLGILFLISQFIRHFNITKASSAKVKS